MLCTNTLHKYMKQKLHTYTLIYAGLRLMVVSCMAKKNSPRDATESPFLCSKITKIMETKTNCKMYWRVIGHNVKLLDNPACYITSWLISNYHCP